MFGSRKTKRDELPEEEWNFADILDWMLKVCLFYELAREIEHPESYFSSFGSTANAPFLLEPMPLTPRENREASLDFKQLSYDVHPFARAER